MRPSATSESKNNSTAGKDKLSAAATAEAHDLRDRRKITKRESKAKTLIEKVSSFPSATAEEEVIKVPKQNQKGRRLRKHLRENLEAKTDYFAATVGAPTKQPPIQAN